VLPFTTAHPIALFVPNYDTDRPDNAPGLTLKHDSGSESEQRFGWDATQSVRFRGTVDVVLYATGKNNNGSFVLDARLRSCRGSDCTEIAYDRTSAGSPLLGLGYTTVTFELGAIDVVLAAGDSLELSVMVPTESGRHVWLAYDTLLTASRLDFNPT
jgi:hypothetical protein